MDENKDIIIDTSGAADDVEALEAVEAAEENDSVEEVTEPIAEGKGAAAVFKRTYRRFMAPFDGMHHVWIAFALPVLIMALIYTAMYVYPFGENSVLVLDLNGQYVYYFEAIRDILRGEQGILYSFERALGGEFLGIVAYYLASPFSIITALFPEGMITESLYVMLLLKCGLSGFNMCVYLHKSHPTTAVNEVIFSVMYALTSYAVVMQHNTMWIDCLLFFPLIMLGLESLVKYGKYKLFVITLAVSVLSNYYIGYMVCIGVAAYFFFYWFKCTSEERNPMGEKLHFLKTFLRMAFFSAIAVGAAAIIILPAYYSLSFGKSTFSNPSYEFKQTFDFIDLITKMLPGSYDTVRPEGLPFVYCGTLTLILLPLFFFIKQIPTRVKIAYGALTTFFVLSFVSSTVDLVWHGFQRPNWLNYRYAFMFCFVIIVMAYLVFEHIESINFRAVLGVGAALFVIVVLIQKLGHECMYDMLAIWLSLAFIAVYMIFLRGFTKPWLIGSMASVLCVFVVVEMFVCGLANIVCLDSDVTYSSRTSYVTFMKKWTSAADWINENDGSFYRAEKTSHRKTNDNFALNIRGLSNSTSTLNAAQIEFLQQMGYSSKSHWSKYLGGTPLSDSLLGVKYLMTETDTEVNPLYGSVVFTDEVNGVCVYENEYALPLGYMVSGKIEDIDLEAIQSPFERMNRMVTYMLGSEEKIELFKPYKNITPDLDNVTLSYASGYRKYMKVDTTRAAKLTYNFTPVNDYEIFVYFPSEYKRNARLTLNDEKLSEYFTNETYRIVSLGKQTPGEEIELSMHLDDDRVYLANISNYFYYLDEELYREIMPRLAEGGFEIPEFDDDHLVGSVTVSEDRPYLFLTIPYDEGWKVYVDGELYETFETLGSLTAVKLTAGEHSIEMKYAPDCVKNGAIITGAAVTVFVAVCVADLIIKKKRARA